MHSIYLYILLMATITYLIRVLPFLLLRREVKNRFVRSFLYYVPYATLSAVTFPAILYATDNLIAGGVAFAAAVFAAWRGKSLFTVAACACVCAFAADLVLTYLPL